MSVTAHVIWYHVIQHPDVFRKLAKLDDDTLDKLLKDIDEESS